MGFGYNHPLVQRHLQSQSQPAGASESCLPLASQSRWLSSSACTPWARCPRTSTRKPLPVSSFPASRESRRTRGKSHPLPSGTPHFAICASEVQQCIWDRCRTLLFAIGVTDRGRYMSAAILSKDTDCTLGELLLCRICSLTRWNAQ